MNDSNQICCPKCGSNQLTANKKAFSGRKAAQFIKMKTTILFIAMLIISLNALSQHHRKYNANTSHKGEHHNKNYGSYHAERYKYRKHRK